MHLTHRPRRLRRTDSLRRMVRETQLRPEHLVLPLFVVDGEGVRQPIDSMPGQHRLSIDRLVEHVEMAQRLGIRSVALFPKIDDALKTPDGKEGMNPDGLFPRAVRALKAECPDVVVITDVALDPYSSQGHDGLVMDRRIDNDATLPLLAEMAVVQADAGADVIAPSDMMDGRVAAIRAALDAAGHTDVAILAYTAKYASAYYGPFRDALDSAPRASADIPADKQTYQMDPANAREAMRELWLDLEEGADMVMVKPALPYLDIIRRFTEAADVPIAAYHVSGEYAMIKAAAARGWVDETAAMTEALTGIRRAGADLLLTYFALAMAERL